MSNPFLQFKVKTSKVKIKTIDTEVEIREPSVFETSEFLKIMTGDDGKFNQGNFIIAKLKRVSDCMLNPKMTIEELEELSTSASEAINEVYEAIENLSKKPEGN